MMGEQRQGRRDGCRGKEREIGRRHKTVWGKVAGYAEWEKEEKSIGKEVVGAYEGVNRHGEGREGASKG